MLLTGAVRSPEGERVFPSLTCGVRLAVVLAAVLHLDGGQTQRLHHLVCPLAPVGGAERRHGQREGQRGEGQGQQGAVTPGHFLQHGCCCCSSAGEQVKPLRPDHQAGTGRPLRPDGGSELEVSATPQRHVQMDLDGCGGLLWGLSLTHGRLWSGEKREGGD